MTGISTNCTPPRKFGTSRYKNKYPTSEDKNRPKIRKGRKLILQMDKRGEVYLTDEKILLDR